jgi:hypothetical protein
MCSLYGDAHRDCVHTHVVRDCAKTPGIPPTAVCGSFRYGLQREDSPTSPNPTHGSGWIVQVRPTEGGLSPTPPNTTHGSGWIVQVQPTQREASRLRPRIPPTAQWVDRSSPAYKRSVSGFSFFVCSFGRAAEESDDKTKGRLPALPVGWT